MTKNKLQYDVVLTTGRAARALKRTKAKAAKKGILESPLGKMRPRQDRKAMAKSLKVPFQPRYNGPVTNMGWKLIPAKNEKYTKLVLVAK